ncbi:MAG TPA: BlaI/MecI/CopY family transcriptional regulator [Fimbriimonadaceae bacterium]|nr:BlaI/MecI/CopY family transcriptional regulator [Fimbriimonadaceae bacterium]
MSRKPGIGQAESEILRFIADRQGATVNEVAEHIAETKGQSRNTVMTVMERLRAKGFLARAKADGIYRYSPVASKSRVMEGLVQDFVEGVLGGSVSPLVAYLTNRVDVGEEELAELKRLVEKLGEGK